MASAAREIPKAASSNRDNLTAVADRGETATVAPCRALPTPPNSISPALPAHGLKAQLRKARLEAIDSDLDLGDARIRSPSPAAYEASGAITSAMLAKYHLPEILLNHGPLAIRHIVGYLTTSVPGFSGIPPNKARRLVVGALEGRRDGEGADVEGAVEFSKVGWGRWNAHRRARHRQATSSSSASSGAAIPISRVSTRSQGRARAAEEPSMHLSPFHAEEMETEADNMSMDGSGSASCSEAPDDEVAINDDPDDVTDDEDWAAVGAAALRAESYPSMAAAWRDGNNLGPPSKFGGPFVSTGSGMVRPPHFPLSALADASDAQEREAVEALLRLGSV
ncbi:hypothetical protein L249_6447 [Ophiocordyceps polyrhachis-furcata BCC 54312]|uniref:Sin3 binding protein n=1 Tax=Ophiocordyceps polyrhachis-furcata BCC 54312 TaxID=1330021 RepID=A0A367LL80_9HYPO|nr:hypothetical protein L249_6447 [Ophiocordyceps polyrhachis-furcata BCC 54312]